MSGMEITILCAFIWCVFIGFPTYYLHEGRSLLESLWETAKMGLWCVICVGSIYFVASMAFAKPKQSQAVLCGDVCAKHGELAESDEAFQAGKVPTCKCFRYRLAK